MFKQKQRIMKYGLGMIIFLCVFVLAGAAKIKASSSHNVTGWLWGGATDSANNSSGLGWISMNDTNRGGLFSYGVNIPATDGPVTGYAWSENVGWINFDPAGPYPAAPNSGVTRSVNNLEGWARIVSIQNALAEGNSGGWQGWIKMSGSSSASASWECSAAGLQFDDFFECDDVCYNYSEECQQIGGDISYGVTIDPVTGNLSGYAWSDELGAISFSGASTTPVVTGASGSCVVYPDTPPLDNSPVNPNLCASGTASEVSSSFDRFIWTCTGQ